MAITGSDTEGRLARVESRLARVEQTIGEAAAVAALIAQAAVRLRHDARALDADLGDLVKTAQRLQEILTSLT